MVLIPIRSGHRWTDRARFSGAKCTFSMNDYLFCTLTVHQALGLRKRATIFAGVGEQSFQTQADLH